MFSIINTACFDYRYPFSNEKTARIAPSWQLWRNFERFVSKTLQIYSDSWKQVVDSYSSSNNNLKQGTFIPLGIFAASISESYTA